MENTNGDVWELHRGIEFSVASNGPDLYLRGDRENGAIHLHNIQEWLRQREKSQTRQAHQIHTTWTGWEHDKHTERAVEDSCQQHQELIDENLGSMYAVVLSKCAPALKDQVFKWGH